jgi:hypothetical protein
MQLTRFDFDVITGPALPRPVAKPDAAKSEPVRADQAAKKDDTVTADPPR